MAYERQYHTNGDVLEARHLNHMEAGIKENSDSVSKLSEDIATKASAIKEKASGEVIVATDSAEAKPLGLAIDGKSEQNQYSGKNQYNFPVTDDTKNECSVKVENGVYTFTGNATADSYFQSSSTLDEDLAKILKNGSVKIVGCPPNGSNDTYLILLWIIAEGLGQAYYRDTGNGVVVPQISGEITSCRLSILIKSGSGNGLVFKPMVTTDLEATYDDFEPFVGGKPSPSTEYEQEIRNIGVYDEASGKYAVEVILHKKNLYDKEKYPLILNKIVNEVNGEVDTSTSNNYYGIEEYVPFLGLDEKVIVATHSMTICFYNDNKKLLGYYKPSYTVNAVVPKGTKYIRFDCHKDNVDKVQIELGTTRTDYEVGKETTATVYLDEPLRKGDKAYWNGEKLIVERNRVVTVFDGSDDEGWFVEEAGEGSGRYRNVTNLLVGVVKNAINNNEVFTGFCDSYIQSTPDKTYNGEEGVCVNTKGKLYVYDKNFNTLDVSLWKAHLAENPITVEYELATPITEEIDIDLGELSMFYPTTILSNDCNANMEVEYIADTKAYIDKKITEVITAML